MWLTSCVDWLRSGHGWKGCSKNYPFPPEFDLDYVSAAISLCLLRNLKEAVAQGEPVDKVCKETAPNSGIFTREWSKADVKMDCNNWKPTITMK